MQLRAAEGVTPGEAASGGAPHNSLAKLLHDAHDVMTQARPLSAPPCAALICQFPLRPDQ